MGTHEHLAFDWGSEVAGVQGETDYLDLEAVDSEGGHGREIRLF